MLSELATSFIAVIAFNFADGHTEYYYGDNYLSFDACMVQAEADAKIMNNRVEEIEQTLPKRIINDVQVYCEPVTSDTAFLEGSNER